MTKDIEVRQELIKVHLKDQRTLYFPATKYAAFCKALKTDQFVEVEGMLVNRNLIMTVEPERNKEDVLINLDPDIREAARERFARFKADLGRWPNTKEKQKIIFKIQNNQ